MQKKDLGGFSLDQKRFLSINLPESLFRWREGVVGKYLLAFLEGEEK